MIDVRLLRTDPDGVRAALARRGDTAVMAQLDEAIALDEQLRELTAQRDRVRAQINDLSKQVGAFRREGRVDEAANVQDESRRLGDDEHRLNTEADAVEHARRDLLLRIPNIIHPDVPDGASDADNLLISGPIGLPDEFPEHQRVPHWDIGAELGILDPERATKISGSMFTMVRGLGATLARALCQLALDRNADAFEEIRPPSLVSTATLTATGQLPKFADDVFAIERDGLWCIPTGETPLTSMYADEILDAAELPMRLMTYTPCFRREAGAAGRDTRGLLRSHEFDKVEILALATAEQAPELLVELRQRAEAIIAALELPYRVLEICSGDLGQSHHRSFDIEVYAPGADQWLEVSSVSWFSDYQGRRANIRARRRDAEGKPAKGTEVVHTLNGSALAVPRVWAALVENHRQPDGSVRLPVALHPYLRGATTIPAR
jgi:seryl-tRNA synthetase